MNIFPKSYQDLNHKYLCIVGALLYVLWQLFFERLSFEPHKDGQTIIPNGNWRLASNQGTDIIAHCIGYVIAAIVYLLGRELFLTVGNVS
jgi:hypothetical protein